MREAKFYFRFRAAFLNLKYVHVFQIFGLSSQPFLADFSKLERSSVCYHRRRGLLFWASEVTAGVFYMLFKEVSMCRSTIVTKELCCAFISPCYFLCCVQRQQFKDESVNLESLLVLG